MQSPQTEQLPLHILYYNDPDLARLLASPEDFAPLGGAFTPDHIVYCKARFMFLDGQDVQDCVKRLPAQRSEFFAKYGYAPRVICARGIGAFCCADTAPEAENALALLKDAVKIAVYSRSFGGPRHLSAELTDFISNWEIESYRQKVALSATKERS